MTDSAPYVVPTKTHSLATLETYWDAVESGVKTFEVRRDDRGFQRGDVLLLRKLRRHGDYINDAGLVTSHAEFAATLRARVSWILTGGQLGIEPGYVVMSLCDVCRVLETTN